MDKRVLMGLLMLLAMVSVSFGEPNEVVFELDATQPGSSFWKQWEPTVGAGLGTLVGVGPKAAEYIPMLMSEDDGAGNYAWYYHFDAIIETEGLSGGYARGYAFETYGDMKLDPRQSYTFEAWIRRKGTAAMSWAEHILGNYNRNEANGWGFWMYGTGTGHTFARPYARMRDNAGTDKADQKIRGNSYNFGTDPTLWHHVVVTWNGIDPDGITVGKAATYFDGVNNFVDLDGTAAIPSSYWESDNIDIYGGDEVRVGSAYNNAMVDDQLWFRGDIAVLRVYNGALSQGTVEDLYTAGMPTMTEASPTVICTGNIEGDLSGDCQVDLEDFAMFAADWMLCNLDPVTACFN